VFYGKGSALTPMGAQRMDVLADFLKRMPCRVIISEIAVTGNEGARGRLALERSWSMVNYLLSQQSLPPAAVSISPSGSGPTKEGEADTVELVVISKEASP
jgi:hypothetical protein